MTRTSSTTTLDIRQVHPLNAASTSGDEPITKDELRRVPETIPVIPNADAWEQGEQVSAETLTLAQELIQSAGSPDRAMHVLQLLIDHGNAGR